MKYILPFFAMMLILPFGMAYGARFSAEIDLNNPHNAELTRILGHSEGDRLGSSFASGDFNGDGREDAVIGAYSHQSGKGCTYVFFGSGTFFDTEEHDIASNPQNMLRIYGRASLDWSGWSVTVGNLNNDAYDDIIIGAYKADPSGRINAGEVYVIFGAANMHTRGTIDLATTSSGVVRIYGAKGDDAAGYALAIGDINHDSIDDLIIGAHQSDYLSRLDSGIIYVLYGSASFASQTAIDLNTHSTGILRVYGANPGDMAGYAVAAGDVDNDGDDELIVGSYGSLNGSGATYVIPGYADIDTLTAIDLLTPPAEIAAPNGIVVFYGDDPGDHSGAALATGDLNGDGFQDIIIGAPGGDPLAGPNAGETNVFFGEAGFKNKGIVYIGSLVGNNIRFTGAIQGDETGSSVSAGDLNGDGRDELLIGSVNTLYPGRLGAGATYIVWGANDLHTRGLIDMTVAPEGVTAVYGASVEDGAGQSFGACDIDGDGIGDLFTGSTMADPEDRAGAGVVDVIKGFNVGKVIAFSPPAEQYVNRDTDIEMFFNTDLDSLYVDVFASYIGDISDSLYFDRNRAVFSPDTLLAPSCYVNVTVNGIDSDGVPITQKQWTFYTKPDELPPRFVSIAPVNGEVNVSPRENIVVTFSPDIYRDSTYVTIRGKNDRVISMAKSWSDSVLTLVNNNTFLLDEQVTVGIDATDQYFDRSDSTWTFRTRPETRPPFFRIAHPGNPNLLPKDAFFSIFFPLDIDKTAVTTYLEGSQSGVISGNWAWADTVYTFTHEEDFRPGETLNLVVSASDIHRNTISDSLFVYSVKPDEVPPSILSRTPAVNEVNVAHNKQLVIEFSPDVVRDSTTVTVTTVQQGSKVMQKTWNDYTLTLYSASNFLVDDIVTVSVNAGDLFANRMQETWSFRIRPETVPPYFTVKVPNTTTLMGVNDYISLVFPGDIDKSAVATTLVGSLNDAIPGTWAWADTVYTFTPSLPYKRGYTLTLTVEAKDIHLNTLTQTRTFIVKPDDTPPSVLSRIPESNQIDVPKNQQIIVNFTSDVVRDSTRVSLTSDRRTYIAYSRSWIDSTMTLTPVTAMLDSETVTVTIDAGDLYANRHTTEWSFSTGSKVKLPYYRIEVPFTTGLMRKNDPITVVVANKVDMSTVNLALTGSLSGALNTTWAATDTSFTFTPSSGYRYGESLTLSISAYDTFGNYIPQVTFPFTVRGDETPPLILGRSPGIDERNVAPTDSIIIALTQDVVRDSTTFMLSGSRQNILSYNMVWDGSTMRIVSQTPFLLNETIAVTVATADTFANRATYSWRFYVRSELTPPTVSLVMQGDPNLLGIRQPLSLQFAVDIDKDSVTAPIVGSQSGLAAGEVSWYGTTRTFTPSGYTPGETLTMTVDGKDVNGNPLPQTVYTFTVKGDEIPPAILSISPEANAINVYPDDDIVIEFSPDTVPDSTSVTVTGSIQGTINLTRSWNNRTLTLFSDNSFRLGERITVSVNAGDLYANRLEDSWQFNILPNTDPPVFQLRPSGDADNLAINASITLAFPEDVDISTVSAVLTGSESGALNGAWSWSDTDYTFTPSVNYEYGETITLVASAVDIYGNVLPPTTETLTVGSHTPWLTISSVDLQDAATNTYRVSYTVIDPDNSFTVTRNWMYSIDGGLWTAVPDNYITNNRTRAPGDWYIDFKLTDGFKGIYSDNVRFRMEVFDGLFSSGWQISPPFHVDRNNRPVVAIRSVSSSVSAGLVHVNYSISDAESDSVSLAFEYSINGGLSWHEGQPEQNLDKIPSNRYIGTMTWQFAGNLTSGIDYAKFRVRLTPSDYNTGVPVESENIRIDLNEPPTLTLDNLFSTQSGDVVITFHIADAERDTVHVDCYYSTDGGTVWHATTNVTGNRNITSSTGAVIWQSKRDVPSIESFQVRFRAIPRDNDIGTGDDTEVFQLINNGPPVVAVALQDTVGNFVTLPYTITDPELDPVTLHVEWSDNGEVWRPATVAGNVANLASDAHSDSLVWDSRNDAGSGLTAVVLRVFGTDEANPVGSSAIQYSEHAVVVDNAPPSLMSAWGMHDTDILYFRFNETVQDTTVLKVGSFSLSSGLTVRDVRQDHANRAYYLLLSVGQRLPLQTVTLTVTGVTDRFGNRSEAASIEFFPDDDNDNPTVTLGPVPELISGDQRISFTIADTENDTVSLTVEYSLDNGASWLNATVVGNILNLVPSAYSGEFIWRSGDDLAGHDTPGVLFRVTASDFQAGEPSIAGPFEVDNNAPPAVAVSVADPDSIYSGLVEVSYSLIDSENDILSIASYFSLDNGATYTPASVSGAMDGIDPSRYSGTIIWNTSADIPDMYSLVLFKTVPYDSDEGAADSLNVWVDNYGACRVALSVSGDEHANDVPVYYSIQDPMNRQVSLTVIYSLNDGETWFPASVEGTVTGLEPGAYNGMFVWMASGQIEGYEGTVHLKAIPDNGMEGIYHTVSVAVDYNDPPAITVMPITEEVSDDVAIQFTVVDAEQDIVSVYMEYSIDGGTTWYEAEAAGPMSGFASDGSVQTVVWRSNDDLPGRDSQNIGIRLTVFDNDQGNTSSIANIHLDNNRPPSISLSVAAPDSVYEDFVDIGYVLSDPENNMLTFAVSFSVDGGVNYHPATVTGSTGPIFSSGYSSSIRWEIADDISHYGDAVVKIVATDTDTGMPDSLVVAVNTFGVSHVTLSAPPGEHENDVTISYSISDRKNNQVTLLAEYSVNSGVTWNAASTTGTIAGITPDSYTGTFVWRSSVDLARREGDFLLRVLPDNGAPGVPDTLTVSVDYNEPPVIADIIADIATIHSGPVRLAFMASDTENDIVSISLDYSLDGGLTYHSGTATGSAMVVPGRYYEAYWSSFDDLGFVYGANVMLRLNPADNDPGVPRVAGPFTITNLVGDFNFDKSIDGSDLIPFTNAWKQQDTSRETGPATGTPPVLAVEPDGRLDFEDLASFVWMWNWFSSRATERTIPAFRSVDEIAPVDAPEGPVSFVTGGDGSISITSVSGREPDFLGLFVAAEDGARLDITAADNGYWSDNTGLFLTRSYGAAAFELAAARFDDALVSGHETHRLGLLTIGRIPGNVVLHYSVRFAGDDTVVEGTAVIAGEDLYARPDAFALHQNTPNPFNPATTISFSLAGDCHATVTVRNIAGQVVEVLADDFMYAGEYRIRWDASRLANGVYFCTLKAGSYERTRKMMLVK